MVGKSNQFSINQPVHMYYLIYQTYTGYKIRRLDEEGIIKQFLLFFNLVNSNAATIPFPVNYS